MDKFTYKTSGVCSRSIDIEIEDGVIVSAKYTGGCHGTTQGISALVVGMSVDEAIKRLSGIRCGFKETSCPDKLATALKQYQASK
jgi:uncharacterized protein (TIGR03905 family)